MTNQKILRLLAGFRRFKLQYFDSERSIYKQNGQSPKTLIIGCSDSRVDPAMLTGASPGEIFVVRNVANLVPPFETTGQYHGVSAAIEFAVSSLKVENIIILGHRQCGGIQALMQEEKTQEGSFISQWMSIAQEAKSRVLKSYSQEDFASQCRHCEMESIAISVSNLKTFPFVRSAIESRDLQILGIYFDLEHGEIHEYNEEKQNFHLVEVVKENLEWTT